MDNLKLLQPLIAVYQKLFVRPSLYRFHFYLYNLALKGMGMLNFENDRVSGELFVLELLAKNFTLKTCFDVGAHRGNYTQLLQEKTPTATIFAFEPHPGNFSFLKEKAHSKKVKTHNFALGSKKGKATLWDHRQYKQGSQHATLQKDVIETLHHSKARSIKITVSTLDSFVKEHKIKNISLLKIDTEGSELSVLQGAEKILKRKGVDFVQFEFNSMNIKSRTFFADFVEILPGYNFFRLFPSGLLPLDPNNPSENEIFAFQNILAVSPQKKRQFQKLLK